MTPSRFVSVLAVCAGAYGLYTAAKAAWYLQQGKGCDKCEATQAALGLGLVVLAGWVLARG